MPAFRRCYRGALFFLHILSGVLVSLIAHSSSHPERWSQLWFRGLLRLLNVKLRVHDDSEGVPGGHLYAGNHVSWLDIAVLVSARPVIFVSKAEVARWPLVGWMAKAGDTQFIERGAHGTRQLNEQITALLAAGRCVVIFPEGTTTRGPGVRHFHSRLFAGAVNQNAQVQPFALRYQQDSVPYVGDDTMQNNLWNILAEPVIHAELHFGPCFHAHADRKSTAKQTQSWVEKALQAPPHWQA